LNSPQRQKIAKIFTRPDLTRRAGYDTLFKKEAGWMEILVIDAQGGGVGRQLVGAIKAALPDVTVTAVGTNSAATAAMRKAGADRAATGENAVLVNCRCADVIVGPVGIVIADAMYGEVTPAMAIAVGQSRARRILLPMTHCDNTIVGVGDLSVARLVQAAVEALRGAAVC